MKTVTQLKHQQQQKQTALYVKFHLLKRSIFLLHSDCILNILTAIPQHSKHSDRI